MIIAALAVRGRGRVDDRTSLPFATAFPFHAARCAALSARWLRLSEAPAVVSCSMNVTQPIRSTAREDPSAKVSSTALPKPLASAFFHHEQLLRAPCDAALYPYLQAYNGGRKLLLSSEACRLCAASTMLLTARSAISPFQDFAARFLQRSERFFRRANTAARVAQSCRRERRSRCAQARSSSLGASTMFGNGVRVVKRRCDASRRPSDEARAIECEDDAGNLQTDVSHDLIRCRWRIAPADIALPALQARGSSHAARRFHVEETRRYFAKSAQIRAVGIAAVMADTSASSAALPSRPLLKTLVYVGFAPCLFRRRRHNVGTC